MNKKPRSKRPQKNKTELGAGIRALLDSIDTNEASQNGHAPADPDAIIGTEIAIDQIEVNPFQPRVDFDETQLQELADSISIHGVIQPITLRRLDANSFQLISGERRLRAATLAGLQTIPAYIRAANDQEMLEIALIENIQRQDLNPMEIAQNYQRLLDECQLKHEQLGVRLGKNRSTITNYLRLLKLPPSIQLGLKQRKISMGHARALCALDKADHQLAIFNDILIQGLSVRKVEQLVRQLSHNPNGNKKKKASTNIHLQEVQDRLARLFDTRVQLKQNSKGKGNISIAYNNTKELNRILDLLDDN